MPEFGSCGVELPETDAASASPWSLLITVPSASGQDVMVEDNEHVRAFFYEFILQLSGITVPVSLDK